MSFALEEARLWRYIKGTAVASPPLVAKKDDNEDWLKKIYAWKEKIVKFQDNTRKAIAKIEKMCTNIVQKKFFSIKSLRE